MIKRLFTFCLAAASFAFGQSAGITNVTVTFSATPTFTVNAGSTNFDITLTGNVTSSTFSSAAAAVGSLRVCQDATGGRTFTAPTGSAGFGTVDATANHCSTAQWKWDGTTLRATSPFTSETSGLPVGVQASGAYATCTGDLAGSAPGCTVHGVSGVPLCTGFTPTNGQVLQYTTTSAPNPCYTAATISGGGGTVTSVTVAGTANQITVTGTCTGTTTISCTLSLPSALQLPGTINKLTLTQPATGATFTVLDGKTVTVNKTLTFDGTDGVTITFPASSATVATLGLTNTFTGRQDATGAAATLPNRSGTGSPVARDTCTKIGETYFQTDAAAGQNLFLCTATGVPGTWSQPPTGGGASYAYHAYTGTSAIAFASFNDVVVTASGANPTVTVASAPASAGTLLHITLCNDGTARTWTLPATFKNIAPPSQANECIGINADYDGTNYNGDGSTATPSIVTYTSERADPGAGNCPGGGCDWPDSTAHNKRYRSSADVVYAPVKISQDVNNETGQVTATHLAAPLPVLQGGTGTTSPGIVAGTNVTVTGTWPNQTVNSTGGGGGGSVNGVIVSTYLAGGNFGSAGVVEPLTTSMWVTRLRNVSAESVTKATISVTNFVASSHAMVAFYDKTCSTKLGQFVFDTSVGGFVTATSSAISLPADEFYMAVAADTAGVNLTGYSIQGLFTLTPTGTVYTGFASGAISGTTMPSSCGTLTYNGGTSATNVTHVVMVP